MTPHMQARRALARAMNGGDTLAAAYMRLFSAYHAGRGVRLTADEANALIRCDNAMLTAAENIAEELCPSDVDGAR